MPVSLMYKNPTSRRALRRDSRKAGLVSAFFARERSRIGIELKDIAKEFGNISREGKEELSTHGKGECGTINQRRELLRGTMRSA